MSLRFPSVFPLQTSHRVKMKPWIRISCQILWCLLSISPPNPSLADESPAPRKGAGDKLSFSSFSVGWLDDNSTFQAGDIATIKIMPFDNSMSAMNFNYSKYAINFSLTVSGKKGNSSYVSGVLPYIDRDPTFWNISFTTIRVGVFTVVVTEEYSGTSDSTLHFTVTAGHIHPHVCVASWMNRINEFVAGTKAYILVVPKDAFGNNISSQTDGPSKGYFTATATYENGSFTNVPDLSYNGWNEFGYIIIEFIPITAGNILIHLFGNQQSLSGSPLPFKVEPGSLDVSNSVAKWKHGTNSLQIFSKLEVLLYLLDQFNNLVPGLYQFDARVVEKATKFSVPVTDLHFQEMGKGIQLLSFVVSEPGSFALTIFKGMLNQSISNMPCHFAVFTGYCHGLNSFANGSGLAHSVAGRMSHFSTYLEDQYHNPSPIEAESLHVQITSKNDNVSVSPVIIPLRNFEEHDPAAGEIHLASGPAGSVAAFPSIINRTVSDFNITYTPEVTGEYEIRILCGNIPINDGHPYSMNVSPDIVDTSVSSVLKYATSIKRDITNEVLVQLMDAFLNAVNSLNSNLSFQIEHSNSSSFLTSEFLENEDGLYVGSYITNELGTYNICVLFDDKRLSPCPIEVHAYEREYFPDAGNDNISVWEDESVAFDVLSNDYISGGPTTLETSTPLHGSLLHYGQLLRYTPYRGFFGNDSFSYTIYDINKNAATGTVFISILCKPPQFISLPANLHVTEDVISPKFGGFSGFGILYSDITENISVTIRAQFGIVLLAPTPIQLYKPLENMLSVSRGGRAGKDIILESRAGVVNSALQFIQYLGDDNFFGNDIINSYASNKNGIQEAQVPVFVEPINDAPVIHSPKVILVAQKESSNWLQVFNKQTDNFEFFISDPDIYNFPGNKSNFLVTFSMEVSYGTLSTSLPVHLLSSAELKIKSSNQWQPLQTFVTISNHFVLNGKGVRFQGTIGDCNKAIQRLFYQGSGHDSVLTITVNDMGNYGCYPDCAEMMSLPLSTQVVINLIKKRPTNSLTPLLLGSAIIIEIFMMLFLSGALLFFMCKCMADFRRKKMI